MNRKAKYLILLKGSLMLYILFFSLYFFTPFSFTTETLYNDYRELHFFIELFILIVVAPIVEELIFRAPLLFPSKKWAILLLFGALVFMVMNFPGLEVRTVSILLWALIIIGSRMGIKTINHKGLIGCSIVAFAGSHLPANDFFSFNSLVLFVFFLAGSFLLTWVVLNYGLIKVMVVHAGYNFISFALYLLILNYFFDDSLQIECLDNNITCFEWKQNALFKSSLSTLKYEEHALEVKNGKVKNVLDLLSTLDLEQYNYVIADDAKIKYDIIIYNKNNQPINDSLIVKSLNTMGLIKILNKSPQ